MSLVQLLGQITDDLSIWFFHAFYFILFYLMCMYMYLLNYSLLPIVSAHHAPNHITLQLTLMSVTEGRKPENQPTNHLKAEITMRLRNTVYNTNS